LRGIAFECDAGRIAFAIIAGAHGAGRAAHEDGGAKSDVGVFPVIQGADVPVADKNREGNTVGNILYAAMLIGVIWYARPHGVVDVIVEKVVAPCAMPFFE